TSSTQKGFVPLASSRRDPGSHARGRWHLRLREVSARLQGALRPRWITLRCPLRGVWYGCHLARKPAFGAGGGTERHAALRSDDSGRVPWLVLRREHLPGRTRLDLRARAVRALG